MTLIKWRPRTRFEPFRDLMGMRDEINRLFDISLGGSLVDRASLFDGDWAPAIDVYENNDKVVVKTELPGMDEKNVELSILGDTLTIKGEKKKEEVTWIARSDHVKLEKELKEKEIAIERLQTEIDGGKG